MAGGSCGTAVCAALEVARGLDEDKVIVVLLPDTGERYLSKFHSDEWMREKRMFDTRRLTVEALLRTKDTELPPVAFVNSTDTIHSALARMKDYGVTQLPVRRGEEWAGRVLEGDMLDQLLGGKVKPEDTVEGIMDEPFPMLGIDADYPTLLKLLQRSQAILIHENGVTKGILTKADLVDYMLTELG